MKMKRIISIIFAIIMLLAFASCGGKSGNNSSSTEEETFDYVSLINDKKFKKGFSLRGTATPIYGDDIEKFAPQFETDVTFTYGKDNKPSWILQQQATRYPFHDTENTVTEEKNGKTTFNYSFSDLGNGVYKYDNQSKTVTVDTENGEIGLNLRASECYKYDRVKGQEWPHLLISQNFGTASSHSKQVELKNTDSVLVTIDMKLNSFENHMQGTVDKDLHSAVCMLYLYVSYMPSRGMGYTDMMWLGLTLFDNRTQFAVGMSGADSGTKASETDKWIYNIPATNYLSLDNNVYDENGNLKFDTWANVEIDVYSYIESALKDAQRSNYMKGATMDKLYISGTYLGFELPGTYDIDMSFKNYDIKSYIGI